MVVREELTGDRESDLLDTIEKQLNVASDHAMGHSNELWYAALIGMTALRQLRDIIEHRTGAHVRERK